MLLHVELLPALRRPRQQILQLLGLRCEDPLHVVVEVCAREDARRDLPLLHPPVASVLRTPAVPHGEDPQAEPHVQVVPEVVLGAGSLRVVVEVVLQEVLHTLRLPDNDEDCRGVGRQADQLADRQTSAHFITPLVQAVLVGHHVRVEAHPVAVLVVGKRHSREQAFHAPCPHPEKEELASDCDDAGANTSTHPATGGSRVHGQQHRGLPAAKRPGGGPKNKKGCGVHLGT
mmetsp:Transcript_95122/g.252638  ORF Transcript_95122/g.252638 Transcript_95122/m.252638 type:complete len:231 (-) Transcript_95122:8-700(-)